MRVFRLTIAKSVCFTRSHSMNSLRRNEAKYSKTHLCGFVGHLFLWIAKDPHDWNYMLDHFGMLGSTKTVAGIIRFMGTSTIIIGSVLSVYFSFSKPNENADLEV